MMNAEDRFRQISEKHHKSVIKHVEEFCESSEEEELSEDVILTSVLKKYDPNLNDNVGKVKELLEDSFRSGAIICLVCISSIKRPHAIWSCKNCYSAFHLNCISQWAKDSTKLQLWNCPKCRFNYPENDVPEVYKCFCGKSTNPEFDPWLLPHSCGKECGKPLSNNCQHVCLLLCHPGPCPPCPQSITVKCNCGKGGLKSIRCSIGSWCCNNICEKVLSCKRHNCVKTCHIGDCDECKEVIFKHCQCKTYKQQTLCKDSDWQCETVCGKPLLCGYHKCQKKCHSIECGKCYLSGTQKCPCGLTSMEVTCPDEVPSCGGTCNKLLDCGSHFCPNKCHKDACPKCIEIIDKYCRCGTHCKMLPCSKEFLCQTKCKNIKSCGLHPCNKKCCDGNCTPCTKVCGKTLRCGKHKCELSCHLGPCYPCGISAKVACRCGNTVLKVPCGREKKTKPPHCNKICRIPRMCRHSIDKSNKHSCHFGSCPECKEKCEKSLECGHNCEAACHDAVPIVIKSPKPTAPWELRRDQIEIKCLKCPPCVHFKERPCLGGHDSPMMPCTVDPITSCGKPCGRPLKCGRHTCAKLCHVIINENSATKVCAECEICERQCDISRPEGCKHPCQKTCHSPPCEPCHIFLKQQCHCGIMELFVECSKIYASDKITVENNLSCKQQCSKSLSCSHRCGKICHSDECLPITECLKKTAVFCDCKRLKKMFSCNAVSGVKIECDNKCMEIIEEKMKQQSEADLKLLQEEEERNKRELAEFERKFKMDKKSRRPNKTAAVQKSQNNYIIPISAGVLTLVLVLAFYINNF